MKTTRILLTAVALWVGLAAIFMPGAANAQSPVAVATGLKTPGALAIDGNYIYFSETDGFLSRALKSGGPRELLISNRVLRDIYGIYRVIDRIAFSPTHIYYGYGGYDNYRIEELPRGGSSPRLLSSPSGGGFMGLIGSSAYYFKDFCCLQQLDVAPGATPQQVANGVWPRGQAPDDNSLYFVDYSSKIVYRHDAGTSNALVPLITGNATEGGVLLDTNNVYLIVGGIVRKTPKIGGPVTNITMPVGAAVRVVDDSFIYFTVGNQLWRKAVTGGLAEELVIDGVSVAGMVADANFLYWGDHSGGAGNGVIYRLQKALPPPSPPMPTKLLLPVLSPEPPTNQVNTKLGLVVAVHGWNASSEGWPEEVAALIKSSLPANGIINDIKWTVVPWDWGVEAAANFLSGDFQAPKTAWANAHAIGEDLANDIAVGTYDYVHLIAHSAGSQVIQTATEQIRLKKGIKQPKIHLTFLDAYHPGNHFSGDEDWSSYGPFADYAEQFVDRSLTTPVLVLGTDTILGNVFNFDVTDWSGRTYCALIDLPCVHRWPYEWYRDSVALSSTNTPYLFGYSRSVEAGNQASTDHNGLFKRGALCTLVDTSSNCAAPFNPVLTTLKFFPGAVVTTTSSIVKKTYKSATGFVSDTVSDVKGKVLGLFSGSPVWVTLELDLPEAISGLRFDYQFGGTGEGLLTVYLDDQRVYAADQRNGTGVQKSASPFAIGSVSAGKHFLSFRLDNFDGPPSSVDLSAITFGNFALEPLLNVPPIAVAGEYQTVRVKSNVALNGSGSYDPDSTASSLDFKWWQVGGPAVTLSSPTAALPLFTPLVPGKYAFNLSVNDGLVDSYPASVVISVPALGDIDLDGDVDTNDLAKITSALNQAANGPNDLRDIDGDGKITALDSRKLVTLCTRLRCATQ